jgi:hypothetical protein
MLQACSRRRRRRTETAGAATLRMCAHVCVQCYSSAPAEMHARAADACMRRDGSLGGVQSPEGHALLPSFMDEFINRACTAPVAGSYVAAQSLCMHCRHVCFASDMIEDRTVRAVTSAGDPFMWETPFNCKTACRPAVPSKCFAPSSCVCLHVPQCRAAGTCAAGIQCIWRVHTGELMSV